MSYLIFTNNNEHLFTIQLRADRFVKKWEKHLQWIVHDTATPFMKYAQVVNLPRRDNKSKDEIKEQVDNLHRTILTINDVVAREGLSRIHTDFPLSIDELDYSKFYKNDLSTQLILNELHRYFTTADRFFEEYSFTARKKKRKHKSYIWSDKFRSYFVLPDEDATKVKSRTRQEQFSKLIQDINQIVHNIDDQTKTPRVIDAIKNNKIRTTLTVGFNMHGNYDVSLHSNAYKLMTEKDMLSATDSDEYDVWMGVDLLGKDYITGYYNHEDPTEWDIRPLNCYTGKMEITLGDNTIQRFIKGNDFQNWLKDYGVKYEPAMCGVPLGKVVSGRDFLDRNDLNSKMKNFKIKIER